MEAEKSRWWWGWMGAHWVWPRSREEQTLLLLRGCGGGGGLGQQVEICGVLSSEDAFSLLRPLPRPSQKPFVLAQRYVDRPLLVEGRKFGIRVWVLVTGYNPLRAYLHTNGLVLFSTHGWVRGWVRGRAQEGSCWSGLCSHGPMRWVCGGGRMGCSRDAREGGDALAGRMGVICGGPEKAGLLGAGKGPICTPTAWCCSAHTSAHAGGHAGGGGGGRGRRGLEDWGIPRMGTVAVSFAGQRCCGTTKLGINFA